MFRPDSKLLTNFRSGKGRQPLIVAKARETEEIDSEYRARWNKLEENGAQICIIPEKDGKLIVQDRDIF